LARPEALTARGGRGRPSPRARPRMRLPDGIGRGGFEARGPSRHRAGAVRLAANVTRSDRSAGALSIVRARSALACARRDGRPRLGAPSRRPLASGCASVHRSVFPVSACSRCVGLQPQGTVVGGLRQPHGATLSPGTWDHPTGSDPIRAGGGGAPPASGRPREGGGTQAGQRRRQRDGSCCLRAMRKGRPAGRWFS